MSPGRLVGGLGRVLSRWSERVIPDPFIFTILLTLMAFALGLAFFQVEPGLAIGLGGRVDALMTGWMEEFFTLKLMRFAFQMCIVLVTGHALALSGPVQRGVRALARLPKSTPHAAVLVAVVALISGLIHWGLGAVVGAFLAREIAKTCAREGRKLDYPVLGAAAYMGLLVWHGGLSGSGPLKVATDDHFLIDRIGVISTADTLGSSFNLIITGVIVVVVPLIFWLMAPRDPSEFVPYDASKVADRAVDPDEHRPGVAGALERSTVLAVLLGGGGLAWLVSRFAAGTASVDLDTVNFFFLFLGILLHASPIAYMRAATDGARGGAGIVVQFPFYFGILGLLKASGLVRRFAEILSNTDSDSVLAVSTFASAGLVNMFVPSGGGQWAVQGDVLAQATARVGADMSHMIMAFAYGDQLTNMLQPFWALPLLAITGLKAKQIIGYTGAVMLLITPIYIVLLATLA